MSTSEAVTNGVRVEVEASYSAEHSDPQRGLWFFLYRIRITNDGDDPVKLVSRHWVITDRTGKVEEVRGPGVVGEQPILAPGDHFEYTSGCPLHAPFGAMRGTYQMETLGAERERFDAEIAPFDLDEPSALH